MLRVLQEPLVHKVLLTQVPKVQRDLQVLKERQVQEDQQDLRVHKVLLVLLLCPKLKKQKIQVSIILLILLHTLELH